MTSFSAKPQNAPPKPKSVVFVVYPDITPLDLVGPLQVFSCARMPGSDVRAYTTAVVSIDGETTKTDTVLSIETTPMSSWQRRRIDTLVVVGGDGALAAAHDARFVKQLSRLINRSRRICSVCTGAFVLAASGVLDNRRAVTHWYDCDTLASTWPLVNVEVDALFIHDGPVWTSAGITAGIDLALALVADDFGQPCALDVARTLVTYMVRPGGQSQFSPVLKHQELDPTDQFKTLHEWIVDNISGDLRVERLAERMNMSARNFARVYTAQMRRTPAKAVEALRIEAARNLLETATCSLKSVAQRCGFSDDERMRRAFMRELSISPSDYRRRFRFVAD